MMWFLPLLCVTVSPAYGQPLTFAAETIPSAVDVASIGTLRLRIAGSGVLESTARPINGNRDKIVLLTKRTGTYTNSVVKPSTLPETRFPTIGSGRNIRSIHSR